MWTWKFDNVGINKYMNSDSILGGKILASTSCVSWTPLTFGFSLQKSKITSNGFRFEKCWTGAVEVWCTWRSDGVSEGPLPLWRRGPNGYGHAVCSRSRTQCSSPASKGSHQLNSIYRRIQDTKVDDNCGLTLAWSSNDLPLLRVLGQKRILSIFRNRRNT